MFNLFLFYSAIYSMVNRNRYKRLTARRKIIYKVYKMEIPQKDIDEELRASEEQNKSLLICELCGGTGLILDSPEIQIAWKRCKSQ